MTVHVYNYYCYFEGVLLRGCCVWLRYLLIMGSGSVHTGGLKHVISSRGADSQTHVGLEVRKRALKTACVATEARRSRRG